MQLRLREDGKVKKRSMEFESDGRRSLPTPEMGKSEAFQRPGQSISSAVVARNTMTRSTPSVRRNLRVHH